MMPPLTIDRTASRYSDGSSLSWTIHTLPLKADLYRSGPTFGIVTVPIQGRHLRAVIPQQSAVSPGSITAWDGTVTVPVDRGEAYTFRIRVSPDPFDTSEVPELPRRHERYRRCSDEPDADPASPLQTLDGVECRIGDILKAVHAFYASPIPRSCLDVLRLGGVDDTFQYVSHAARHLDRGKTVPWSALMGDLIFYEGIYQQDDGGLRMCLGS